MFWDVRSRERKLYASNKCFIWVKSIPIWVQSGNSSNLQTNLSRNSKVTCHNFLFSEVLAVGRALDWARINPVIKPWQRHHQTWHRWHLPIITASDHQWPRKCPNLMTDKTCSESRADLSLQFPRPWHWLTNVTLHWGLATLCTECVALISSPPQETVVTW